MNEGVRIMYKREQLVFIGRVNIKELKIGDIVEIYQYHRICNVPSEYSTITEIKHQKSEDYKKDHDVIITTNRGELYKTYEDGLNVYNVKESDEL